MAAIHHAEHDGYVAITAPRDELRRDE